MSKKVEIKKCLGCGSILQTDDVDKEGFVKSNVYAKSDYCERCFKIMHYGEYSVLDKKIDENLFKKVVVIEEPEENLHPALQSKLADLFMEVSKLGVNVLVETHSEYLIRRSQVLVAEAKYKDEQELAQKCPFKVYYLPETGTGKPYEMTYSTHGNFTRPFGNGFYDEADNLAMLLML